MRRLDRCRVRSYADDGSVLILALVFFLGIGLLTAAVAGMAVGAGVNTSNARSQQVNQANVESEVSLAIEATRGVYYYSSGCTTSCYPASGLSTAASVCTPATATGALTTLSVWCKGSGGQANGKSTRTVDFYVCQGATDCTGSVTAPAPLYAEVVYTDLSPGAPFTADQCTTSVTATCGITLTIAAWDVRLADS